MAQIGGKTIASLLEQLYGDWYKAKGRHRERYEAGLGELRGAAEMYGPGYMAGQERTAIAGAEQAMVGRGLGGTTRPMAVSAGMRAGFEDVRREKRAGAMADIAGYMGGFREMEADPGVLAHLATGGFSGMLQEKGLGLQERQMGMAERATAEVEKGPSPWEAGFMGGGWALGGGGAGGVPAAPTAPTMPSYTTPGGSYGEMGGVADIKMAPGAGGTYYGAAYTGEGAGAGAGAGVTEAGADKSAQYQEWRAEMKRRYPWKPVMPQSRWERLVLPKMGGG